MKPFNPEKAQFYYDTASSFQDALVKSSNQLLEYEDKIRTLKNENAELKKQVDSLVSNLAAAHEDRNEEAKSVFLAKQVEIPELLRENAALRAELEEIKKAFAPTFVSLMQAECVKLEGENAALRKDKERLDLLNTLRQYYSHPPLRKVSGWAWSIVDEREERTGDIRDTIDAIKNKTENDKITYHKGPDFMASGVAVVHTF